MTYTFESLEKIIAGKDIQINQTVKNSENTIDEFKKRISKIEFINHSEYNIKSYELERMRNHANYCINKYKSLDLMKLLQNHINNYIEQNEVIIKMTNDGMNMLNNKKIMKLSKICAMTLKSVGVQESDLPEHTREVFISSCP